MSPRVLIRHAQSRVPARIVGVLAAALVAGLLTPSAAGATPAAVNASSPVASPGPVRAVTQPRTAAEVKERLASLAGGDAATYAYDGLGRIVGMVNASGAVAKWSYDATGNVTAVANLGSPAVSVLSAVPSPVQPGASLTLTGKGFATTTSANTVTINGVTATVTKAAADQLVVTVPASASSGNVVVTSSAGTSTYTGLSVASGAAPTIGTFTPTVAAPGTSITVQATNLDPELANNVVSVNGLTAAVTARTATSLTFTVPPGTGGGKLTIVTPNGTLTSAADLVITPTGYTPTAVDTTGRLSVGTATTVTVAAGKSALRLVDGNDGDRFSVTLQSGTPNSCTLNAKLFDARLVQVSSGSCLGTTQWLDTTVAGGAGSRTLALQNLTGASASVSVTVMKVPDDVNLGAVALTGTAKTGTISVQGQNGYFTFAASANQKVILSTSNTATGFNWSVFAPDNNTQVAGNKSNNAVLETGVLQATGTYRIRVDPVGTNTGSITVQAWTVPADANLGSLPLTGTATTGTISSPGQNGSFTIAGTAGQRVIIQATAASTGFNWALFKPDGSALSSSVFGASTLDTTTLPVTGSYTLVVDPFEMYTGSITYKAWSVPADLNLGVIATTGTTKTATFTNPGQNGSFTFSGTAGQKLSFTSTAGSPSLIGFNWSVYSPTSTLVGAQQFSYTTYTTPALPSTGTYQLRVDPTNTLTGAAVFKATVAAAIAPASAGASAPVSARASAPVSPPASAPASAPAVPAGSPSDQPARLSKAAAAAKKAQPTPARPAGTQVAPPAKPGAWHPDHENLQGRDWAVRAPQPKAARSSLPSAAAGVTAVSGRVLTLDGRPLRDVTVRTAAARTRTDSKGAFLLTGVVATTSTVIVDGRTANRADASYGTFRIHVSAAAGKTVPLAATVWMPRLDMAHTQKLAAPTTRETVLSTPDIPGLQVRIPAGSVVKDVDGKVVRELGITAVPIDRPPFPLPANGIVPVYFTVQPGGGSIFPTGAQVIYPNYTHLPRGTRVNFYNYDPTEKGWYVYGHGQVSPDGAHVVPDADTRVWNLDGSMFNTDATPKHDKSWWQDLIDWVNGDPVEVTTGQMTDSQTDLAVSDTMPISLTRTYWQGDNHARAFGLNQAPDYDMFLYSDAQETGQPAAGKWQVVDLYLPGGAKVHYLRTSPGTSFEDAIFTASGTPGEFRDSTITQATGRDTGSWVLTTRAGAKYLFPWFARLSAIEDRNGNRVTYTRYPGLNDEVSQITSPNGRWIALQYDGSKRITSARDSIGRSVSYTYDTSGRLATVTDVNNKVRTYTYDGTSGRIATIKDARQITYLSVLYDAYGRVKTQTLPEGGTYTFDYTPANAAGPITETRVTQPNGSVQRTTIAADGFVSAVTEAYGATNAQGASLARTTSLERGTDHRINAVVDPFTRRTEIGYDSAGRPNKTTVLAGTVDAAIVSQTTYDNFDLPKTTTDAASKVTTYGYDTHGNLTSVLDPENRLAKATYRTDGQVDTSTDTANKVTNYAYTGNTLATVTDPLGRISQQFIDGAGRVASTTDPMGAGAQITYDKQNQVTKVVDQNGAPTSYEYDENGNLKKLTDPRTNSISWTYDNADRVKTTTDALLKITNYTYDTAGRPKSVVARSGLNTTIDWDALDRPTLTTYGVGTGQQSSITYGYDTKDRLGSLTDTVTASSKTFTYDARDRLSTDTGPKGTVTYTYDAASRPKTVTSTGQPATTYDYNNAGQLTTATQGAQAATVGYDTAGRTGSVALPNSWKQTYTYDDASQLTNIAYTQASTAKGNLAYTYDAAGRRRTSGGSYANAKLPAARTALIYDAANRLTSAAGTALTYDLDGNLKTDGTNTYTWDPRGQLTGLSRTGLTGSFNYDALGDRSARTVNGATTGVTLDGANTSTEQNGAGTTTATLLSGGVDQWFSRTAGSTTDAVLTDAQGSVIGLGAADGTLAASYAYDPYGTATTTGSTHGSDLGYTGRQDDATGLMYYRDRYYSPTLQRFISEDPIGIAGGTNLYAYAANSPTNLTDPSGNNPLLGCALGAATGAVVDYTTQRLSGRKVTWGEVGGSALSGCAMGAIGSWWFGRAPSVLPGGGGNPAADLAQALRQLLVARAGFTGTGERLIVDENLPSAWAAALRAAGYDARSIREMGLNGTLDAPLDVLARQVGAKVLTRDVGRQLDGGFGEIAIQVDYRVRSIPTVLRILGNL